MKNVKITRREFGDVVQAGIHRVLDAAPLSAELREKIKSCGGCAQRRETLNRVSRRARKIFASADKPDQG